MNKVASYLQGHIAGEVFDGDAIRSTFSRDGSILAIKPSLVVYPRTTNYIRKVALVARKVAEKVQLDKSSAWRRRKSLKIQEYNRVKNIILAVLKSMK